MLTANFTILYPCLARNQGKMICLQWPDCDWYKQNSNVEERYEKLYFSDEKQSMNFWRWYCTLSSLFKCGTMLLLLVFLAFMQFGVFIREEPINGVWCGAEYGQDGKR